VLGIHCLTHEQLMHFLIFDRSLRGEFFFSTKCLILNIMCSTIHGLAFHSFYIWCIAHDHGWD
jgi:hypothetical protein